VFGRRRAIGKSLPEIVRAYSGQLPMRDASEADADAALRVRENAPKPKEGRFEGGSPYRKSFRQGATLVPRMLCLVERKSLGRLGGDPTAPFVISRRNSQEKQPWKSLPGVEHRVEAEFLHPVLLGESILPHRVWRAFEGVVPVTADGTILDAEAAANRGHSGLRGWMAAAEAIWNASRPSAMSLPQQFDYYGKLAAQFPLSRLRVVYSKAGTLPAACIVRDDSVIDHKLYWFAPDGPLEASYLTAILNSETARARVEGFQSRGQWGARDFDKVMFNLPIPTFNATQSLHRELAATSGEADRVAGSLQLPEGVKFQRARKLVRDALTETGVAQRIESLVARLLDQSSLAISGSE
jgi:hypothetical protein